MTYNLSRKYSLKQYENFDLYVEGLESIEDVKKELEKFDQLAEEYRQKIKDPELSTTHRIGNDWFYFKDGKLYKKEKPDKLPEGAGMTKLPKEFKQGNTKTPF